MRLNSSPPVSKQNRKKIISNSALKAFFDESGTHEHSPIVAIGGYVSTIELWDAFQKEWDEFISKNKIEKFHSTDLRGGYREFTKEKGWGKKRGEAALRIADNIISKYVLYGALAYTTIADCEKVFPLKDANGTRRKYSAEYLNCGLMIINLITKWAEANNYTGTIQFVFEKGAEGKGYLMQALELAKRDKKDRAHLIGSVSFEEKKNVPQLHSADRLANLAYKSLNKFLKDESYYDDDMGKLVNKLKLGNVHALDSQNFPLLAKSLGLDVSAIYQIKEQ